MSVLRIGSVTGRPGFARAPRSVRARGLLVALAIVTALAGPAAAQDHLWLGWDNCRSLGGGADVQYACGDPFAFHPLVLSFRSAVAVDSVIGVELVLDYQSAAPAVPAFWQLYLGGCNDGRLSARIAGVSACTDPWGLSGVALVQEALLGQPRGLVSQMRIIPVASVPTAQARRIEAGVVYDALQLDFVNGILGSCVGCATPACLVLNSARLKRLPGAADVIISGADSAPDNMATWNSGDGADCQAVPAVPRTWGQIKALYR